MLVLTGTPERLLDSISMGMYIVCRNNSGGVCVL